MHIDQHSDFEQAVIAIRRTITMHHRFCFGHRLGTLVFLSILELETGIWCLLPVTSISCQVSGMLTELK